MWKPRSVEMMEENEGPQFEEVHYVYCEQFTIPIKQGDFTRLPVSVKKLIMDNVTKFRPRAIYICDGSLREEREITQRLLKRKIITKMKWRNCYLARTDPADVARVESKTFIVTPDKFESVAHGSEDAKTKMGQWMSPAQALEENEKRWPGCMRGRLMYVIPFMMGPLGSEYSKIGIQLTDSGYVVLNMHKMTRISNTIWDMVGRDNFVTCIHSVGSPRTNEANYSEYVWACNPDKVLILHFPHENKIMSFGSGYGGNSLLGKKCFALRIGSYIARQEGWLAEHMLVLGITNKSGQEQFIAAAFPSACGKTNMAMMESIFPERKVRCVGDDIAWMRFDQSGQLRAINPENGFFGVAPGTNWKTNKNAMATMQENSIFTNVALTRDGCPYWAGLEDTINDDDVLIDWKGKEWSRSTATTPAAHPNSRFTAPASQCPIIHPQWEDPEGVPISAIIFGGRRPKGIPLVYEANGWTHGVFIGCQLKSETTSAAEFKGKSIMHDPMAMRPFMGYNFGRYLDHWISLDNGINQMPKIFHVNWFRTDDNNKFLWPGFSDNARVLDWILDRLDGKDLGIESPLGIIPKEGSIDTAGLDVDWNELMRLDKDFLLDDINETIDFLDQVLGCDLPECIREEARNQKNRILEMN